MEWSANRQRTDWPRIGARGPSPFWTARWSRSARNPTSNGLSLGITLPAVGDQLGLASIESWPAAGGGLLVGIADRARRHGAAPSAIKTLFLHLDRGATVKLVVPYADLEPEAAHCMVALAAAEVQALPPESIALDLVLNQLPYDRPR